MSRTQLKTGPSGVQGNAAHVLGVTVVSVDPGAKPPIAVCKDPGGRMIPVRIDMQRGKGSLPQPGERWILDQAMGFWTFACYSNGDPTGTGSAGDLWSVSGLPEALEEQNEVLNNVESRLDEMWSQGTVTAVTATTADVRLIDGTTHYGCQTVGAYKPTVNDLVWTARSDAAGARVVMGPAASAATNLQSATAIIGGWVIDKDYGGTPMIAAPTQNASILAYQGAIWIGNGDNSARAPLQAQGWRIGHDPIGNPTLLSTVANGAGLASSGNTLYVVNSSNSLVHLPLVASELRSDGAVRATGNLYGTEAWTTGGMRAGAGISCGAQIIAEGWLESRTDTITKWRGYFDIGLRAGVDSPVPAAGQVQTWDLTANRNLAVVDTFYYRNIAQAVGPSERDLKEHIEDLGDPWDFLNALVPARYRWVDTEHFDDRPHVGLYVNEMVEADPDTVIQLPQMPLDTYGHDEDGNLNVLPAIRYNSNIGRSYEDRAVIAYLVRAVTDLQSRLRAVESSDSAPKE
jgi:hypothetical protein